MRLLVLGGGGFLGYHAVAEAVAQGHDVTVLSRSGKAPVDGVEVLVGDRQGDLSALRGREWDGVFDTFNDTAPGAPAIRTTARLLSGAVGGYAYVSGMSVYAPGGPAVPDEEAPVRAADVEPLTDRLQERSLAKLAGEAAVREAFDGVALFPRVGIMVGPRSSRFTYWPLRLAAARDGWLPRRVLVPGDPDRPVQFSDARDIARWSTQLLAAGLGGTFNTVGPGRAESLRAVLRACLEAVDAEPDDVELVEVPHEKLLRGQLIDVDEEERPLWYPEDQICQDAVDSRRAAAAGLVFRPTRETAADTWRWAEQAGSTEAADFVEREQGILRAWRR